MKELFRDNWVYYFLFWARAQRIYKQFVTTLGKLTCPILSFDEVKFSFKSNAGIILVFFISLLVIFESSNSNSFTIH
jgi:hypothetical protein